MGFLFVFLVCKNKAILDYFIKYLLIHNETQSLLSKIYIDY